MRNIRLACLLLLSAGFVACGGGGSDGAAAAPDLLTGNASASAANGLPSVDPIPAAAADRSGDLLLTRISVTLKAGASVADFNAAARAVGATGIAGAEPGSPFLTLIVPRQSDGAALARLAGRLQSSAGILFATPGRQLAGQMLPGAASGSAQTPDQLQHLLPTRFPAAWNAAFTKSGQRRSAVQSCARAEAIVIVVDFFQSVPADPGNQLAPFSVAQRFGAFQAGTDDHGWQVAATLDGAFDELLPTGATALTDCVELVLVDVSGLTALDMVRTLQNAIAVQAASAHLIVNLSVGFSMKFCGSNFDTACTEANLGATPLGNVQTEIISRIQAAMFWASTTSAALDDRLVLVQAAGNNAAASPEDGDLGRLYRGLRQADLDSPIALATRLGSLAFYFSPDSAQAASLWTSEGRPSLLLSPSSFQLLPAQLAADVTHIPDLLNLVLVGSATNHELAAEVSESAFSNENSALLAVGEAVVGLGGTLLDGTSFAAPQVAGLAAYLWSISELEDRPAQETVSLIKNTTTASFLLDAYAATLALDVLPTLATVGIREVLVDVNGDGKFDVADLVDFEQAYGLDDPNTPTIPASRDYGRFDLNGDGATGGIMTTAFDLDRQGPPGPSGINAVDREIEGYPITFNEAAVSDLQILCYYAYSALYADDNPTPTQIQARTDILGPDHCVGARMNALLPAQISGSSSLDVTVEVPSGGGQFAPAADMLVTFTPSCATVSPASGRTDASGNISTTVTPTAGCTSVSITAVASADVGTTAIAQKVVSATVPVNFSMTGRWRMRIHGYPPGLDYSCLSTLDIYTSFGIATINQTQDQFSGSWDYQGGFCGVNIPTASGTMRGRVALNSTTEEIEVLDWTIQVASISSTQACVAFMPGIEVRSPSSVGMLKNAFATTDAFGAIAHEGCPSEVQFQVTMARCGTTNVVCP